MAKRDLSTMKDEEYKLLTPQELMQYNQTLPQIDYDDPYIYKPYPKMKFRLVEDAASGTASIQTTIVASEKEDLKLGDKWKNSPLEFGVETAPAAPEMPVQSLTIPVPAKSANAGT